MKLFRYLQAMIDGHVCHIGMATAAIEKTEKGFRIRMLPTPGEIEVEFKGVEVPKLTLKCTCGGWQSPMTVGKETTCPKCFTTHVLSNLAHDANGVEFQLAQKCRHD